MWDPVPLTKVIQYTVYMIPYHLQRLYNIQFIWSHTTYKGYTIYSLYKTYDNSWIGNVLADDCAQAVYKT